VKIMDGVVSVSAGYYYTLAIKEDGSLWAWGYNFYGQLGDGKTYNRSLEPVKIMDNVVSISAGHEYSMAIKEDGSLWTWGKNINGQLGDGTTESKSSPVKIMDQVIRISAGEDHSKAIKQDSSLWAWGYNGYGQLGDGTTEDQLLPIKIMDQVATEDSVDMIRATPSTSQILVNNKKVSLDAYLINGNNFLKLRDIAAAVNGTEKQFTLSWDSSSNIINLESGKTYSQIGGELILSITPVPYNCLPTSSTIYIDGQEVQIIAYNINGNNYFKLRDIAKAFNFNVIWDAQTDTTRIDTKNNYIED
jgi:hypothetical protein